MKTHTETQIIAIIESAQDVAKSVATMNEEAFPLNENLRSGKLKGYSSGMYVVISVRCSEKYRFIMTVSGVTKDNLQQFADESAKWHPYHRSMLNIEGEYKETEVVSTQVEASVPQQEDTTPKKERPFYYITEEHKEVGEISLKMLQFNPSRPVKILAFGESGYGKTTLAQHIAYISNMDCFRMNCATVRDPEEWFGQRAAKDGSTFFEKSAFIQKVEAGNCVIILDEFNRMEPWVGNSLYPMMDDDAHTTIMNEVVRVGPNVIFFATVNLGFEYSGTFSMDAAMSNRFNFFVEVGEYDQSVESTIVMKRFPSIKSVKVISQIVETARAIRHLKLIGCTLRTIIQVAEAVEAGMPVRKAWQHVFVYRCPQDGAVNVRKEVIDIINSKCSTL
jgi:Holliday junction resolvasome RuvABC ATP-dependent DNA helicase subunit